MILTCWRLLGDLGVLMKLNIVRCPHWKMLWVCTTFKTPLFQTIFPPPSGDPPFQALLQLQWPHAHSYLKKKKNTFSSSIFPDCGKISGPKTYIFPQIWSQDPIFKPKNPFHRPYFWKPVQHIPIDGNVNILKIGRIQTKNIEIFKITCNFNGTKLKRNREVAKFGLSQWTKMFFKNRESHLPLKQGRLTSLHTYQKWS